ncbi:MAG: hypothetical protein N3B01_09265 [Verrucomicrobiae bacterium]|nr:hypothetical protein [Verrucomicrobiae bacterium]
MSAFRPIIVVNHGHIRTHKGRLARSPAIINITFEGVNDSACQCGQPDPQSSSCRVENLSLDGAHELTRIVVGQCPDRQELGFRRDNAGSVTIQWYEDQDCSNPAGPPMIAPIHITLWEKQWQLWSLLAFSELGLVFLTEDFSFCRDKCDHQQIENNLYLYGQCYEQLPTDFLEQIGWPWAGEYFTYLMPLATAGTAEIYV